jgi:hypothetical protein
MLSAWLRRVATSSYLALLIGVGGSFVQGSWQKAVAAPALGAFYVDVESHAIPTSCREVPSVRCDRAIGFFLNPVVQGGFSLVFRDTDVRSLGTDGVDRAVDLQNLHVGGKNGSRMKGAGERSVVLGAQGGRFVSVGHLKSVSTPPVTKAIEIALIDVNGRIGPLNRASVSEVRTSDSNPIPAPTWRLVSMIPIAAQIVCISL